VALQFLPTLLPAVVTQGLMHADDDVRAVAADTLLPIAPAIVE
jgi:hypothetical protein